MEDPWHEFILNSLHVQTTLFCRCFGPRVKSARQDCSGYIGATDLPSDRLMHWSCIHVHHMWGKHFHLMFAQLLGVGRWQGLYMSESNKWTKRLLSSSPLPSLTFDPSFLRSLDVSQSLEFILCNPLLPLLWPLLKLVLERICQRRKILYETVFLHGSVLARLLPRALCHLPTPCALWWCFKSQTVPYMYLANSRVDSAGSLW